MNGRKLVERGGHAATLEELYEVHAPGLRRRCLRLTGDPHAAEDLMQEVFVRFLARFPEPPADMHVAGYLYATARNLQWKQLRDRHETADPDIETAVGSDDDLEVDPERSVLLVEQRHLVRRCAAALTGRQRRALELRDVEGQSYAEIGSDLGIGTDAVAQTISRARARLRGNVRRAHVDLDRLAPECRAMVGPLSEYLDGHAASHTAEIEAHVAGCETCRQTLAAFRTAGSRLRGGIPLAPIAGLLARVGEAVRIGGGGAADAVRAGALAIAAAVAIGGGGMVAARDLGSAPKAHAVIAHGPSAATRSPARATVRPASDTGSPAVVRGRSAVEAPAPSGVGRHHRIRVTPHTSSPATPAAPAAPAARPPADPVHPSAPTPTPVETPVASEPPSTPRPPDHPGGGGPAVTTPVVVGAVTDPVAGTVNRVTEPVVTKVVDPIVQKVVAPVVNQVVAPVTKAVEPLTAPVTQAVAPVTDPVQKAVDAVLPTSTAPSSSAPAVTTPAVTTPVVTVPSITLPLGLGQKPGS
jgi:RNA polymerase sigma factor (sigma-70 family)